MEKYLDNAATTICDITVVDEMQPYLEEQYGNPETVYHLGVEADKAIHKARDRVATLIGSDEDDVFFTSGGTESNNWVLKSIRPKDGRNRIIATEIEHPSILNTLRHLGQNGLLFTLLAPDEYGLIDPEDLKDAMGDDVLLVSIQHGNNEIGTMQPIEELAGIAHEGGALFHTDAVQTVGKVRFDVDEMDMDFMSMSAHKLHGPKGVGALYVKPGISIESFLHGGNQERGGRSGTLNVPGIVGFGKAAEIAWSNVLSESVRQTEIIEKMSMDLHDVVDGIRRNGHHSKRLPNILSVTIPDVECQFVVAELSKRFDVCIGCGSACSKKDEPSYVIRAIGGSLRDAFNTLRISISRYNTYEDCVEAGRYIAIAIGLCRRKTVI